MNERQNGEKRLDVVVLSAFQDKYTKKKYKKGDVINGITENRFKEILSVGELVKPINETNIKK